ncbi:MAG: flagellar motor protein [Alicyclobacillus sp.]|nr:flagellar motor protein [Alicyclobacillus sp.]
MDIATIGGILLAVVSLVVGFTLDGGSITALINPSALILVIGGTLGATMVTVGLGEFLGLFKYVKIALLQKKQDPLQTVDMLIDLASVARREGILALEERLESTDDAFLRNALQLVVDGVDMELVQEYLDTEITYISERHKAAAKLFEAAGGFAPTMGIIGTVMGLVHVLGSLTNIDKLGPLIATAFTATLYGVASANVLWLPIAAKLRYRSEREILMLEMVSEGVLSIQAGENPNILSQKLRAFLPPSQRVRAAKSERGEAGVETART